jgi:hypothetical protein
MDRILVVKGRVDHKQEGETKLLAVEVAPFEAVAERKEVTIKIDARVARAGVVRDLALLVKDFPGESRVNLLLEMSDEAVLARARPAVQGQAGAGLLRRGESATRRGRGSLVEAAARCEPLSRLPAGARNRVEMTVVMQEHAAVHVGDRRDQEVRWSGPSVLASLC